MSTRRVASEASLRGGQPTTLNQRLPAASNKNAGSPPRAPSPGAGPAEATGEYARRSRRDRRGAAHEEDEGQARAGRRHVKAEALPHGRAPRPSASAGARHRREVCGGARARRRCRRAAGARGASARARRLEELQGHRLRRSHDRHALPLRRVRVVPVPGEHAGRREREAEGHAA